MAQRRTPNIVREFPLIGTAIRLPKPTPDEIESFRILCEKHFSVTLSAGEATYFATKTLQLAYVLQPTLNESALHSLRSKIERRGGPPDEKPRRSSINPA